MPTHIHSQSDSIQTQAFIYTLLVSILENMNIQNFLQPNPDKQDIEHRDRKITTTSAIFLTGGTVSKP